MLRALAQALLVLALVGGTLPARATPPPRRPHPAPVVGPSIARPTELVVERVRIALLCSEGIRDAARFEARYTVWNPGPARVDLTVAFNANVTGQLAVTVDGVAPRGEPAAAEVEAIEPAYMETAYSAAAKVVAGIVSAGMVRLSGKEALDRTAFRVVAEAGTRHEIVVSGQTFGFVELDDTWTVSAVVARHLVLGTRGPHILAHFIDYRLLRAGVRVQGDVHLYPVGLVTSIDVYPRVGSLPLLVEGLVLAQVGL